MSISSTTNRVDYIGNGATSVYAYTYRVFDEDDLLVTVQLIADGTETTLTKTTDYTVSGVGEGTGGNITLVSSGQAWLDGDGDLLATYQITIRRVLPLTQNTDIRNQGSYFPEAIEDEFDRSRMIDLQQQDELDRSLKLSESIDPADFNASIPASIVGQNNVTFMTNASGDGIVEGPTASEISLAQGYATAAGVSEANAAASEAAAAVSETNAANSATAAQTAVDSVIWRDVDFKTNADSPIAIVDGDRGKLFAVDCTAGSVVINLPSIAALDLTDPWSVGIKKTDGTANTITINRDGTDLIDGGTSLSLDSSGAGVVLIPDTDPSPDEWTAQTFGIVEDGAVTEAKIANGAVTADKIGAGAVTAAKIDPSLANSFVPSGAIIPYGGTTAPTGYLLCDGSPVSRTTYSDLYAALGDAYGEGDGSTTFNVPDLRYTFLRGRGPNTSATGSGTAALGDATFTAHGFTRDAIKVRLTSGTLTGLSSATDYWVIVVDDDTLAFASTRADALAGIKIGGVTGANSAVITQYEDPDVSSREALAPGGNTGDSVGSHQEDEFESHTHTQAMITYSAGAGFGANTSGAGETTRLTSATGGNETRPQNVTVNYIIKT